MPELDMVKTPYSIEAEQSVLGAVVIDNDCLADVIQIVSPEDFYSPRHKSVYEAMVNMFNLGVSVDVVTLLDRVIKEGVLPEDEAKTFVVELAQFVPTTANVKRYAEIVKEKAILRRLMAASAEISETCLEGGDAADILDFAEQKIYDIQSDKTKKGFVTITAAVTEAYDRISEMAFGDKSKYAGIRTHFYELDEMIGGLKKSDLIILAARPAMGKTSLAMNIAENVAVIERKKVAVFSLEMSALQLTTRIISSQSKIDSKLLLTGRIKEGDMPAIAEAASVISGTKFLIDDSANIKISEMKAKLRREKNVDLVIIDYLQLMQSGGKFENRVNEVSAITRNLKIMARELDVPVICLSQLSRSAEKNTEHKPRLSDLRESGSIEQDADIVLMLNRDNPETSGESNVTELIVAKNRHGATGTINLVFDGRFTKYMNMEKSRDEAR